MRRITLTGNGLRWDEKKVEDFACGIGLDGDCGRRSKRITMTTPTTTTTIRKGDIVRLRPEWAESEDESRLTFIARCDEERGQVDISCVEHRELFPMWPRETVETRFLVHTGVNALDSLSR
jgi:hypothetical protein